MSIYSSAPASSSAGFLARAHADRIYDHVRNQGVDEGAARLIADIARDRDERFTAYLAQWEAILAQRAVEAVTAIVSVPGVVGLLLGGSLPRGEAWPLSDIDLIPIYEDTTAAEARREVARRTEELWRRWDVDEGWPNSLDTDFGLVLSEVLRALDTPSADAAGMRADGTWALWYDAVDKVAGGQVASDPHGVSAPFVAWCTGQRSRPEVVQARSHYAWAAAREWVQRARAHLDAPDGVGELERIAATHAVWKAAGWVNAALLEGWGERNVSSRRWGSRFARLAGVHGCPELATLLDEVAGLDDAAVQRYLAAAPVWLVELHDWSYRARRHVGERVTRRQDARDTLRNACDAGALSEAELEAGTIPAWMPVPSEAGPLTVAVDRLAEVIATWADEEPATV
jgi:predicted nucleotidyltransferase